MVVSIFEPHTDIIIRDRRDKIFGHKKCLTGRASNLISDCLIVKDNPTDVHAWIEFGNVVKVGPKNEENE